MKLEDAIIRARAGGALLFLGAGFGYGAKTNCEELENKIPLAQDFSKHLIQESGMNGDYPLPISSK